LLFSEDIMNEKQNNNLPEKEAVTQQVIEELSELLQRINF